MGDNCGGGKRRFNIQGNFSSYLGASLFVVRGIVSTGQGETEDAKNNIQKSSVHC